MNFIEWHYKFGYITEGPLSASELTAKVMNGELPKNVKIQSSLMDEEEWSSFEEMQPLDRFDSCQEINSSIDSPTSASRTPPVVSPSKFSGYRTYNAGDYTYLMAYFEAKFTDEGSAPKVAEQFTNFVGKFADGGFEFYRCDAIPFRITPGCLPALFGAKESSGHCTIVTFRKFIL